MYRFAPSPTGDMHLGNLRVALLNYLCAKQKEDRFIVRIEDMDKKRNIEDKDQEILELLNLFGITYDEVYYQSHNLKFHRQFAMTLMMQKKAFSCFCSDEILETKKERAEAAGKAYHYDGTCENLDDFDVLNNESPFVIRLKKPTQKVTFTDTLQGAMTYAPEVIDNIVMLNHNKYPTHIFACATGDMLQGITHVIREDTHLSNAAREEIIREFIGYDQKMQYSHIPSIQGAEDINVKDLLDEGFLPSAIINYLLRLGNETSNEIFTIEDAFEWFDLTNLSTSAVAFDLEELYQINREHIKMMDDLKLSTLIGFADAGIGKLAKLYTNECSTVAQIKEKIDAIFAEKQVPNTFSESFAILKETAGNAPYMETFEEYKTYLMKKTNLKGDNFTKALCLLLTGSESGPEVADLYPHLKNYLKEILR